MKRWTIPLAVFVLLGGAVAADVPAHASGLEPDEIVSCDVNGADLRGSQVCYLEASLTRGNTTLVIGTHFKLYYQDELLSSGEGSAGFVVRLGMDDNGFNPFNAPQDGDIGEFVIAYPAINRDASGETEGLRGTDLSAGAFAITTARNFTFSKALRSDGTASWIEFDISKTYVEDWYRDDCGFGDFDEETGFALPDLDCEVENGLSARTTSQSLVPNNISFYTPLTFDGFVNSVTDGGYLNYRGTGLSWFIEDNAFQFQIIGPRYASGSTRNSGSLQAFLPRDYMREIYGADFSPTTPVWEPSRLDLSDSGIAEQDLSNQLVTSERNGGLLIELATYQFSAPVFSFAAASTTLPAARAASEAPGNPGIFLTLTGGVGDRAQGSEIIYGSFAVGRSAPYSLILQPSSQSAGQTVLRSGMVNAGGHLEDTVSLPALTPGSYKLVLASRGARGELLTLVNAVTVGADGRFTSVTPEAMQPRTR